MPRNTSGVYSPPSGTLAVTLTTIGSIAYNDFVNDISSAMTGSLPRDGSAGMSANLPMSGNKITGLGAATAAGDAMRFEQFFPSGTIMLFAQAAAPTGWTKSSANNDRMLRVVSGASGGSQGGSWTISGLSAAAHANTVAETPVDTVGLTIQKTGNSDNYPNIWQGTGTADGHTHTVSSTGAWRPLYLDVIAAAKD